MLSLSLFAVVLLILCVDFPSSASKNLSPRDLESTVYLEHNLGDAFDFIPKGQVVVKSTRAKSAVYTAASAAPAASVFKRLEALAETGNSYVVRASVRVGWPVNSSLSVFSFAKPCSLLQSRLSERLNLHLTSEGEVISVSIHPQYTSCSASAAKSKVIVPTSFNSTCSLTQPMPGSVPDTASFVQKIQREEEMRQRNPPDNRGFIQKYWMYILPVMIFFVFSSGGQEPRQGGGGGGGGGRAS